MFIRYNEVAKYWEYDSSLAKAGGGPWIILPIDISQIVGNIPPAQLPANVAYRDINNNFTSTQVINGGLVLTGAGGGGGVYERARSSAIGGWINYNPTLTSNAGSITLDSLTTNKYTLIGETIIVSFWMGITIVGAPTQLLLQLPAGYTSLGYSGNTCSSFQGAFLAQTAPNEGTIHLYRDMTGGVAWPAGGNAISGIVISQIN